MRIRITGIVVSAIALVALLLTTGCTTNVTATNGPRADSVTVQGVGTGSAAPDRAVLSMNVDAKARSASDAMNSATAAMSKLVAAMKATGLTDAELQTMQVSVYQQSGSGGSTYSASQALRITTSKLDKLGKILAEATRTGASGISGPDFSMTSKNPARALAISAAMEDAKTRATATAKAAGRGIGKVVSVSEVVQSSGSPYGYGAGADFSSNSAYSAKRAYAPTVSVGQNEVQAQLSVEYALQ